MSTKSSKSSKSKVWKHLKTSFSRAMAPYTDDDTSKNVLQSLEKEKSSVLKMIEAPSKKVKDPNAPTKPRSAYIWFCTAERERVKNERPELKATEILSELGKRWQKLPTKGRTKYEKQAKVDKQRYKEEMKAYQPPDKEPKGPKHPVSSYMFFCQDHREKIRKENPGLKLPEISKILGKEWGKLSDEEQAIYKDKAAKDKLRYQEELKSFGKSKHETKATTSKPKGKPKAKKAVTKKDKGRKGKSKKEKPAPVPEPEVEHYSETDEESE